MIFNQTRNIFQKKNAKAICSLWCYKRFKYKPDELSTTIDNDSTKKTKTTTDVVSKQIQLNKNKTNKTIDLLQLFSSLSKPFKFYKVVPRPSLIKLSIKNKKDYNTSYQSHIQLKLNASKLKKQTVSIINNNAIKLKEEMRDLVDQKALDKKISDRTLSQSIKRALLNYIEYDLPNINHYPSIHKTLANYSYKNELNSPPIMTNNLNQTKSSHTNTIFNQQSLCFSENNQEIVSSKNKFLSSQSRLLKIVLAKHEYGKIDKEILLDERMENDYFNKQYFEHNTNNTYVIQAANLRIKRIIFHNELWKR